MRWSSHFPVERISERTVEQIVDTPGPQIQGKIVDDAESIPQARTSEHIVEQFAGVPVPQFQDQILEVAEITPRRRIPERTVGQIDDVPVPQIHEQIVEVVMNIPQERISEPIAVQTVDVPTPQILEEIVEAFSAPHERVQQRIVPQPGDQARRVFTDTVHQQGCCSAYCDTTTGPSGSDSGDDYESLASAVHRQSSGCAKMSIRSVFLRGFVNRSMTTSIHGEAGLALDDFVTLLTNSGIPISTDVIWDVIAEVVPADGTCISELQQVQVAVILDRLRPSC